MTGYWNAEFVRCGNDDDEREIALTGTWNDVHEWTVDTFLEWAVDECPCCAEWAQEQLVGLVSLTPGTAWEGDVEGDDYFIARADAQ